MADSCFAARRVTFLFDFWFVVFDILVGQLGPSRRKVSLLNQERYLRYLTQLSDAC